MSDKSGRPRRTRVAGVVRRLSAMLAPIPVCDQCGSGVVEKCLIFDPFGRIHGLCSNCADSVAVDSLFPHE